MNGIKINKVQLFCLLKKVRFYVVFSIAVIAMAGAGGAVDLCKPWWPDTIVPVIVWIVAAALVVIWQHDLDIPDYILDMPLEDNCFAHGGIAFEGETLRDFMEDADLDFSMPLWEVNDILWENGIKKIPIGSKTRRRLCKHKIKR